MTNQGKKGNGESIRVHSVTEDDLGSDALKRAFAEQRTAREVEAHARAMAEEDFRRARSVRKERSGSVTRAGEFVLPEGFQGWQVYRCGPRRLRADKRNEHQVAQAEMMYREFRACGWVDAPEGTKFVTASGHESAADAYFVALPGHIHKEWRVEKEAEKRAVLNGHARQGVEGLREGVDAGGRKYEVTIDESQSDPVFIPIEE